MNYPLISCLCVTRNRSEKLARAIRCFQSQTYPNRELVIVYEDDDPQTEKLISQYDDPTIRAIKVPHNPKLSLGALRNLAVENSYGEFFAQWDDDDWYHIQRLEAQFHHLVNMSKAASILVNWLMFHETTGKAYVGFPRLWEGSILAHRDAFTADRRYSDKNTAEDSDFVGMLVRDNLVYPTLLPQLYIYTFHDSNTWGDEHANYLCSSSALLPPEIAHTIKKILDEKMSAEESARFLDSRELLSAVRYL
jgi:glycosyltransferase involved in cell wall biosynthesis